MVDWLAGGVPIVISTIQKFPFISQAISTLEKKGEAVKIDTAGKRFAVIVDEAHSSQSGDTATELKRILNSSGIEAVLAEQMLDIEDGDLSDSAKEGLLREMLKRPRQPNLSFFAFTATPKFKTKAVFNEPGDDGKSPFHLYTDIRSLVAFSGEVLDPDIPGKKFTETGMNNGVKESELPEKFATEEYQILLVAEKYQTGFDQPLLHTMYVDKRLAGVQAVQTLSRLNRRAPGKTDTFVLDFVNERDEIYKSFKPYYEMTEIGDLPDPQQLYKLQNELKASPVIHPSDIEQFAEVWFRSRKDSTPGEHKLLNAILDQAVERYKSLFEANQEEFKVKLVSFRNLYSFLSQIIPYQDSDLEKFYTYARFLLLKLPRRESGLGYEMEDEVSLRFYRLQKISEGRIELGFGEADPLKGPTEVGTGNYDDKSIVLSQLIHKLNERFGTDFKPADQLFFDQVTEAAVESETLRTAARANTLDNFKHVFERMLEGLFIDRMEGNEEIFDRIMQDASFRDVASAHLMREIYDRLRAGAKAERNAK